MTTTIDTPRAAPLWPTRIFAVVLILFWAPLGVGGVRLLMLGGSPYYLLAAIVFIVAGVLLWCGKRTGALLYLAGWLATVAWSFWEVGIDGWALMPRLLLPTLLGLWLLLPWTRRGLN